MSRIFHFETFKTMNMNTTETNSPLTPIQALNRCLEWFTLHHPTAVLPGTKLPAVQELRNVLVMEELTQFTDGVEEYLQTENAKLKEVLEIARRYATIEYGESAACRVIASEIQKVFPDNGQKTENPNT
jgi:hypothetical protein